MIMTNSLHSLAVVESVMQYDGDLYFDMNNDEINEVYAPDSSMTLVYMSPGEFLEMAYHGEQPEKTATVAYVMGLGLPFHSFPLLKFEHGADGSALVVGHEGRHRSRALRALGVSQMPVLLRSVGGWDGRKIRWGLQHDPDHRVDPFPTILNGECGGVMVMPKSVIF
jgi:hypothetical protein